MDHKSLRFVLALLLLLIEFTINGSTTKPPIKLKDLRTEFSMHKYELPVITSRNFTYNTPKMYKPGGVVILLSHW